MNTIQQHQAQYNNANKTHFKALKGIKYKGDFNPKKYIGDAKAVLELKKSEPFNDFFQKYDVVAKFNAWKSDSSHWVNLSLTYEKPKKDIPQNPLKRGLQNIKKFFSSKQEITFPSLGCDDHEIASTRFAEKIKFTSKEDLAMEINNYEYLAQEKARKAEELKKLNEEIDRLG